MRIPVARRLREWPDNEHHALPQNRRELYSIRMPARKSLWSRLAANERSLRAVASTVVIVAAVLAVGHYWVDNRADARIDGRTAAIADQRIGDSPKLNEILTKLGAIDQRLSKMGDGRKGLNQGSSG